ncbi:MAG: LamG domain-containing protein [Planctomycetes bacterium]|nr:LamG domain-containing protein [Planctomycetota bacterium]
MKRNQVRFSMVLLISTISALTTSMANAQMVASWQFEEGSGTIAKDLQGYGIDLLLFGDAAYDTDIPDALIGISTRSIRFDGSGDFGEAPPGAEPLLNPNGGPWTIMCWFKIVSYVSNGTLIDKSNNYRLAIYDNAIESLITVDFSNTYGSGGNLNDNDWHHAAASYDGQYLKTYVDGILVDTDDVGGPGDSRPSTFRIGAGSISWGADFNGKIDEPAVFMEALDEAAINSLMENGIGTFVNSNLAPFVYAGPAFSVVIPTGAGIPGELEIDGFTTDNTPWPASDPCGLTAYWQMLDGPPGGNITFATDPANLQNTAYFAADITGVYHLQLYATDGLLESTVSIEVDVKDHTYTGLQNHWTFDDNLQDTAPIESTYSTVNDYLESRGALAPYYDTGILGSAVHVGRTDFANNWCWLETVMDGDSPDLELNRNFTVEMYINPTLEMTTTESDQLRWQDLVGKWFTSDLGSQTYYESYEFVINYGNMGLNKADISDTINYPRDTDWTECSTLLDTYDFPRSEGWQHIAFVGDGNGNVTYYIDGIAQRVGTYPEPEFVDTHAPLRIANVLINTNGGVGRASPYVGWIDDLQFYSFNKSPQYFLERARLIPIQGPCPLDGYQYAYQDVELSWAPAKGFPNETPTYDVYFARDGQPLTLVAAGITDNFYDPCETGNIPLLNHNTTYNWKVIAHHSQGTTESAVWSFKTIPANFGGMLGTALIGHWRLEEGTGAIAHDSAGDDDIAYYHYPAVGDKDPPNWIPGWIAGAIPNTALNFRSFEYLIVDPVDINQYINLPKGDYTLACWMKTTPAFVFDDADFISFGNSYAIGRDETSQVVEYYHGDVAGGATSGVTPVGDGYWHHVAAIYKAATRTTDGLISLYVDGQLDATEKVDDNHFIDGSAQLWIAANSGEANNFTGALDDVRIYRRALDFDYIYQLHSMGIVNHPPTVHAGNNAILPFPGPGQPLQMNLDTIINDDGPPLQQNPHISWTQLSGPGTVTFDPEIIEGGAYVGWISNYDNILTTILTFSEPGYYNLRLTADDTIFSHSDDVMVWVQPAADMDRTIAYWRFEQDQKETGFSDTPDGDDPNTLTIANQIPGAPPLIASRTIPVTVPQLLDTVPLSPIPLTGADNIHHLAEGCGERDYWGDRRATSGLSLSLEAVNWPGLFFCHEAITIECWIKCQDENFTALDLIDNGKGLRIFNTDTDNDYDNWAGNRYWDNVVVPNNTLKFEFYLETDTPNIYQYVCIISDILITQQDWTHIAFTYDKTTGIARVYKNGVPAWLTHYFDTTLSSPDFVNFAPWIDHWQGTPGRDLALQENLNLLVATGNDYPGAAIDELRITAETLYPPKFLIVGPTLCPIPLTGDLDGDCDVDIFDMALFCNQWLINTEPIH